MSPLPSVVVIGSLYAGSERGLAADILSARGLGMAPLPVCTSLVVAGNGRVTDATEVPVDTVSAQLEHIRATATVAGVKVGILAEAKTATVVLDEVATWDVPIVLDVVASGPSGETVLDASGIDAVAARLGVADLVMLSKADAELVTNTAIASLDDAQVAAQRLSHRGARAVVIRCGALPYRFYDAADDPAAGDPDPQFADLYYDGEDFALFEAPLLDVSPSGASSAFALSVLSGLIAGHDMISSLQNAKRTATDAVRHAVQVSGAEPRLGDVKAPDASHSVGGAV